MWGLRCGGVGAERCCLGETLFLREGGDNGAGGSGICAARAEHHPSQLPTFCAPGIKQINTRVYQVNVLDIIGMLIFPE